MGLTYTDTLFVATFVMLVAVARVLRPLPRLQQALLLAFSLALVASWGVYDVALLVTVVIFNYFAAVLIAGTDGTRSCAILAITIASDVAILALFKYSNFVAQNVAILSGAPAPQFPLGIPLAISFYTFHVISYVVDVHRRNIRTVPFGQYFFYMTFFPHVIAGPIVRAWQLAPQVGVDRRVPTDLMIGFHYFVTGWFLKTFAADNIGRGIDPIWAGQSQAAATALDHWLVAFLYYCQIYADFAGYSLMALGMARLLGYRLPANFRTPMLAASLQDFWRRWHITLSRWLRDYLYIPLGGSRHGPQRTMLALAATMLLGGLWHGAAWGFVLWGAMHGIGLALERMFGIRTLASSRHWPLAWWMTQLWVTLAWVLFRAPSLDSAATFLSSMVPFHAGSERINRELLPLLLFAAPVVLHHLAPWCIRRIGRRRLVPLLGIATAIMLAVCLIAPSASKTFIYFRF